MHRMHEPPELITLYSSHTNTSTYTDHQHNTITNHHRHTSPSPLQQRPMRPTAGQVTNTTNTHHHPLVVDASHEPPELVSPLLLAPYVAVSGAFDTVRTEVDTPCAFRRRIHGLIVLPLTLVSNMDKNTTALTAGTKKWGKKKNRKTENEKRK